VSPTPSSRPSPASTYRLQITEEFDLLSAAATLPYLHDLGADWVYLSPVLAAESGSDHGYDVADHSAIDPSRGRAAGLAALSTQARQLGMGVLVDIVPNHVGVARPWENEWWWHVLTHGQESPYADAFDIDWEFGEGRLRIPVIGDDDLDPEQPGHIDHLRVEAGELRYYDLRLPIAPGTAGLDENPDAVHHRQHYELVSWRAADHELNYRRFFAINTLAAIRVEDPEWFARSHEEIGRWFSEGLVDGLRIDHPDGLRDPAGYLADLGELTGHAYVLVEKILEPGEELPATWQTAGTTGYDSLGMIDRVLVDPAGRDALDALDTRLRGSSMDWAALTHETKRGVADDVLHAETRRISREIVRDLSTVGRELDDPVLTPERLEDAVAEVLACFGVYRSYLPLGREHLAAALERAQALRPELAETLEVVGTILHDASLDAAQRFQQTSGMVMAKGVEDCAFYRWGRLTSLNEVGGDPSVFSVSPDDLHAFLAGRQERWPHAMNASSTHDTKRGEDVRARISAIAEDPSAWAATLDRLQELAPMPDPAFANLIWQVVAGCWPVTRERLQAYAEKAMREAGDHTEWTQVDVAYEGAVHAALDAVFDEPRVQETVVTAAAGLASAGWSNALAAKLLTLTAPGVPDVYQGSELWEQSLVDPDNRRPVDFETRTAILEAVGEGPAPELTDGLDDTGHAKLMVTAAALRARRDRPELFDDYLPVTATGAAAAHLVGFDRGGAVTLATRLPAGLRHRGGWGDTSIALAAGRYVDAATGREIVVDDTPVPVSSLLDPFPVALLLREPSQTSSPPPGSFGVWAPRPERVRLSVGDSVVEMAKDARDWWWPVGELPVVRAEGLDYGYLIDGADRTVPDPRSRRQPEGVHGRSRTFDATAFAWGDQDWTGRQLAGSVIYELHIGTFTAEGTLDAAIGRLDHLRDLGIDLVELMPVNAVNGSHNWGYDGVLWSAVHEPYGGPAAYQRFVDAAHAAGLGVIQDVVYNHLGPSGNYLPMFGPYQTSSSTTWGEATNLDGPGSEEVRALILDNVRMWFTDFHVDGLRLDAVHALIDGSEVHLMEEIVREAARLSAHQRRPLTVIAESDLNDPRLVTPREAGGTGLDAQWSDDFHHALHVALTGETAGYYADFEPLSAMAKVCERGFFHDGTWSSFRGRDHGRPIDVDRFAAWRLVVASQNHDQVGNRARGDRLSESLDDDQLACAALLTLAGPFTPMLFQGEEWAASTPFQFFTSHPEPELAEATATGRLTEFERMGWDRDEVPDPQDPETFARSTLNWSELEHGRHAVLLAAYRELIALRRHLPALTDPDLRQLRAEADEAARTFVLHRGSGDDAVALVVNLSSVAVELDVYGSAPVAVVWSTPSGAATDGGRVRLPAHAGALVRRAADHDRAARPS
jgi:malto-oligosyltrehalose synthase/malto-oligosyltrehalose trehalohydrolase